MLPPGETEWRMSGAMVNGGSMRAYDGEDLLAGYVSGPAEYLSLGG